MQPGSSCCSQGVHHPQTASERLQSPAGRHQTQAPVLLDRTGCCDRLNPVPALVSVFHSRDRDLEAVCSEDLEAVALGLASSFHWGHMLLDLGCGGPGPLDQELTCPPKSANVILGSLIAPDRRDLPECPSEAAPVSPCETALVSPFEAVLAFLSSTVHFQSRAEGSHCQVAAIALGPACRIPCPRHSSSTARSTNSSSLNLQMTALQNAKEAVVSSR